MIDVKNLNEWQKEQLIQNFEYLKDEHKTAANNEHIWALGSNDTSEATQHENNADMQLIMVSILTDMIEELKK